MKHTDFGNRALTGQIVVTLDRETVILPVGRNSLSAIRAHLECLALSHQRVLGELLVDGSPIDLSRSLENTSFRRVDALTVSLDELPLLLLTTASEQIKRARTSVENALTLVLINDPPAAQELWWNIAGQLKEPVVTLSLMPEHLCEMWCGTSFQKLRCWQLEQIAIIVQRVDEASTWGDNIVLSDAMEKLVLPWLARLAEHIRLWQDAIQAGARLKPKSATD